MIMAGAGGGGDYQLKVGLQWLGAGVPGMPGGAAEGGIAGPQGKMQSEKRAEIVRDKEKTEFLKRQTKTGMQHFRSTFGINIGIAAILKQSQIFTGTIGTLFQILGAFIDVILMAFMPIIVPALKLMAKLIPYIKKAAENTVGNIIKLLGVIKTGFAWLGKHFGDRIIGWLKSGFMNLIAYFFVFTFLARITGMQKLWFQFLKATLISPLLKVLGHILVAVGLSKLGGRALASRGWFGARAGVTAAAGTGAAAGVGARGGVAAVGGTTASRMVSRIGLATTTGLPAAGGGRMAQLGARMAPLGRFARFGGGAPMAVAASGMYAYGDIKEKRYATGAGRMIGGTVGAIGGGIVGGTVGAGVGGVLGSVVPVLGTAVGAGIGGTVGTMVGAGVGGWGGQKLGGFIGKKFEKGGDWRGGSGTENVVSDAAADNMGRKIADAVKSNLGEQREAQSNLIDYAATPRQNVISPSNWPPLTHAEFKAKYGWAPGEGRR